MRRLKPLIIIGLIIFSVYSTVRTVVEISSRVRRLDDLKEEVESLEEEEKELVSEIEYRKSGDFVEKEARDKLQMAYPGEYLLVIPDSGKNADADSEAGEDTDKTPVWKQWYRLFF